MELHYFDVLPSTSLVAAAAAKEGAAHLYTVVAERQTAGRGRLQRSFHSPTGGLYFSTVLRTGLSPLEYGAVTPVAALAVHRAILRVCGVETQIKWVNDLLLDGKKVCGILAESGVDKAGKPYLLLGIGINAGNATFPDELREIATALPCADKDALLRAILKELGGIESAVLSGEWLLPYRSASVVIGRKVTVIKGEHRAPALAKDILPGGALLVEYPDGNREELCVGEISLRLTQ